MRFVGFGNYRLEIIETELRRLTVRLGLTVIYFPIFRQARPDFFKERSLSTAVPEEMLENI